MWCLTLAMYPQTKELLRKLGSPVQGKSCQCLVTVWCCATVAALYLASTHWPVFVTFESVRGASDGVPSHGTAAKCTTSRSDDYIPPSILRKEVVVRRVYYDPRRRDGHSNSVMFLLEAKRKVNSKLFTGCRVGTFRSDKLRFRMPGNYWWALSHHRATEQLALLDCYDIPQPRSGDSASVLYSLSTLGLVVEIMSLKPLVVPETKARVNLSLPTVVVCLANVYIDAHLPPRYWMIYHWLRYQKTIGVDHVHMIVEDSFVRAGGFYEAYTQQSIREGFVSIDFWPEWFNQTEVFYRSQMLAYEDCLYRFQGAYNYILYADYDDYFVPLKGNKSIKHYLQTWCSGKSGSCVFAWRQFYPDCGWDPTSVGSDGNLTATVSYKKTAARSEHKSAHQLKALVDAGVHAAMKLMLGYIKKSVPSSEAYFAHLRRGSHPQGGC